MSYLHSWSLPWKCRQKLMLLYCNFILYPLVLLALATLGDSTPIEITLALGNSLKCRRLWILVATFIMCPKLEMWHPKLCSMFCPISQWQLANSVDEFYLGLHISELQSIEVCCCIFELKPPLHHRCLAWKCLRLFCGLLIEISESLLPRPPRVMWHKQKLS